MEEFEDEFLKLFSEQILKRLPNSFGELLNSLYQEYGALDPDFIAIAELEASAILPISSCMSRAARSILAIVVSVRANRRRS